MEGRIRSPSCGEEGAFFRLSPFSIPRTQPLESLESRRIGREGRAGVPTKVLAPISYVVTGVRSCAASREVFAAYGGDPFSYDVSVSPLIRWLVQPKDLQVLRHGGAS